MSRSSPDPETSCLTLSHVSHLLFACRSSSEQKREEMCLLLLCRLGHRVDAIGNRVDECVGVVIGVCVRVSVKRRSSVSGIEWCCW